MPSEPDLRGRDETHPLEDLQDLTSYQIESLKSHWINSVEALLSLTVNEASRTGLVKLMDVSKEELGRIVGRARDLVGPEKARELMSEKKGGPTGVILSEEQKKEFGMD